MLPDILVITANGRFSFNIYSHKTKRHFNILYKSRNRKSLSARLMVAYEMHFYCNGYLNGCAIWWHYRSMSRIDSALMEIYRPSVGAAKDTIYDPQTRSGLRTTDVCISPVNGRSFRLQTYRLTI